MMRKLFIRVAVSAFCVVAATACKLDEPLSLRIDHVNDTHSHFDEKAIQVGLPGEDGGLVPTYVYAGGYPRIATYVSDSRESAALESREHILLHAGDAFTGSLYFTLFKGELNADFMNYMKFDAMAIGNHEFDLGNAALARFSEILNFPLLSANVTVREGDPLEDRYLPFTIKLLGSKRQPVAIVGLTTADTALISSPSDGTEFEDVIETAKKTVEHLEKLGINKIVFLTHMGLDRDKELAEAVAGIDVVIGGHSHSILGDHRNLGFPYSEPSPVMTVSPSGESVCIMQAGEHSLMVGTTDVEFNGQGIVESCDGQNTLLVGEMFARNSPPQPIGGTARQLVMDYIAGAPNIDVVQKDPAAESMLGSAKLQVDEFASTEVGMTSEPLYHVRLPGGVHEYAGALPRGSMVAPHVAASMSHQMEKTTGEVYVGLMNAGGVRFDLSGTVTVGDAYATLPFSSTLVSMRLTGESLLTALQTNVSNAYSVSGVTFPYVSNLVFSVDLTSPQSPVVFDVGVHVGNGLIEPLQPNDQYNLVTTSYLAGGGDGYQFPGAESMVDTGHVDAQVLSDYIKDQPGGILNSTASGITVVEQQGQ